MLRLPWCVGVPSKCMHARTSARPCSQLHYVVPGQCTNADQGQKGVACMLLKEADMESLHPSKRRYTPPRAAGGGSGEWDGGSAAAIVDALMPPIVAAAAAPPPGGGQPPPPRGH